MLPSKITTDEQWIEAVKSSIINNDKDYTTNLWMRLETGKSAKKVMYELDKLVKAGVLLKITSNKGIRYRFSSSKI